MMRSVWVYCSSELQTIKCQNRHLHNIKTAQANRKLGESKCKLALHHSCSLKGKKLANKNYSDRALFFMAFLPQGRAIPQHLPPWWWMRLYLQAWGTPGLGGGNGHRAAGLSDRELEQFLSFWQEQLHPIFLREFPIWLSSDGVSDPNLVIRSKLCQLSQIMLLRWRVTSLSVGVVVSSEEQTGGVHTNSQHSFCALQGLVCRCCGCRAPVCPGHHPAGSGSAGLHVAYCLWGIPSLEMRVALMCVCKSSSPISSDQVYKVHKLFFLNGSE